MSSEETIEAKAERWVGHFLPLAERGDATAQLAVAWEYARGNYLPRDLDKAESWFRRASEDGAGERAILQLINMLIRRRPERVDDVYREKPWTLGAIDVAFAVHKKNCGMPDVEVVSILERGRNKGNLLADLKLHAIRYRGIKRILHLIEGLRILIKIIRIGMKDKEDYRIIY